MDLVERVKAILLSPKTEWEVIEREPADTAGLYKSYVAILAAIPAVASFVRSSVFGYHVPMMGTVQMGMGGALSHAIVRYIVSLVMVYVAALIIDALAPTFQAQKNPGQALKLAAYSATAGWVAGIFGLIPGLGFLRILGLYSVYLLYLGLAPLMKAPADRAAIYAGAIIVAAIVAAVVLSLVLGVLGMSRMMY